MYPNVRAEMARQNLTAGMLADYLVKTKATVSAKLNGKAPLTLEECKKIKAFLNTDMTLEELFREEVA